MKHLKSFGLSILFWFCLNSELVKGCADFDQLIHSSYADCLTGMSFFSSQMREDCMEGYEVLEEEFDADQYDCLFKG